MTFSEVQQGTNQKWFIDSKLQTVLSFFIFIMSSVTCVCVRFLKRDPSAASHYGLNRRSSST